MKKKLMTRKVLIGSLIGLGVVIAYCGLLIPGLMAGGLAWFVAIADDYNVVGDEEESEEGSDNESEEDEE